MFKRAKRAVFKWSRKIPAVRKKIAEAMEERKQAFEHEIKKSTESVEYIVRLPWDGLTDDVILQKVSCVYVCVCGVVP